MALLRFYLQYWKKRKNKKNDRLKILLYLTILTSVLSGIGNTVLLAIINDVIHHPDFTVKILWTFIGLCLAVPIARSLSEALLNMFSMRVITDMQTHFCFNLLATPQQVLEEQGSAKITPIIAEDLKVLADSLLAFIMICLHGSVVASCLGYMGWLSWKLLIFLVAVLVVGVGIYQAIAARGQRRFHTARQHYGQVFKNLETLTSGSKELKLHQQRSHDFVQKLFIPAVERFRKSVVVGNVIYGAARGIGSILMFVCIGSIIFGARGFISADADVVSGFTLAVMYMISPLESVMVRLVSLDKAKVSLKKIEEFTQTIEAHQEPVHLEEAPLEPFPPFRTLTLDQVRHEYSQKEQEKHNLFSLGPVSFQIQAGEVALICGGNGSGKTTLAKLICGLYRPNGGEILYNGIKITPENCEQYRQQFSAIFVDFHIFETLLGIDYQISKEKADDLLKMLQMEEKVSFGGEGRFSTIDLSQGQRKRLALLTSLLEDRPIYIFDEWTANQDPQFRATFYNLILPMLKDQGKTVLVITHDDKYFDCGDHVIRLDMGKIQYDSFNTEEEPLVSLEAPNVGR